VSPALEAEAKLDYRMSTQLTWLTEWIKLMNFRAEKRSGDQVVSSPECQLRIASKSSGPA
jgi:hypothetical protein